MAIMLSTWSFGVAANRAGFAALEGGGKILDAVEAACRDAEGDLANPTVGVGGIPDASGRVSLDAQIMLSPAKRGAVAGLRRHGRPVSVARKVMEETRHVLLVGPDADAFADQQGFVGEELLTPPARKAWEEWQALSGQGGGAKGEHPFAATRANIEELGFGSNVSEANHDTIGVLGMDDLGVMAGGCTTSGLAFKLPGRVGDSPIVGQGLYVDPEVGAATATGHGELVMSVCGSFLAVERMRQGDSPEEAVRHVLERITRVHSLTEDDQVGMIVLAKDGVWASGSLRPGFRVAVRTSGRWGNRDELLPPGVVIYGQ